MADCSVDGCDRPYLANGMCRVHYSRMRRHGRLDRVNMERPNSCVYRGCRLPVHAKGFCSNHYQQSQGELFTVWRQMRKRAAGDCPPEWKDYDVFCAAVGERPSPQHQFRRVDRRRPWSKDNFVWLDPIAASFKDDGPHYQWVWNLKRTYGISPEEAQLIIDSQGGLCPVCGMELGYFGPTTRQEATVMVEHDHFNGNQPRRYAVRGITHKKCNSGMGMLNDNPANLRRAAEHLEQHERRKAKGICIVEEIQGARS